jgi:VanZ family protein
MRSLARWWPALAWAVMIFLFSTRAFTADSTARFIVPLFHWLFPRASQETLFLIHHLIRKSGHFVEYFILSLLVLRGIRAGRQGTRLGWSLAAIAVVAGYAALDEYHQAFVPGRTPAVLDVLLDTTGGTAAQAIAGLVLLWGRVRERRKEQALSTTVAGGRPD